MMTAADEQHWGLLACGSCGKTTVELTECLSGLVLYDMDIDTPEWSIRYRVKSPDIALRMQEFMVTRNNSVLLIGWLNDTEVEIRRDIEFSDRFLIAAGGLHLHITGSEAVRELIGALKQVIEDIADR